jgi:predicted nucleotidyltransferase
MKTTPLPAWLDEATSALVEDTVRLLIKRHANILLAVILFGSVARHEERPAEDASPSDVDLLAILDTTDRLVRPHREDIFATIIDAYALHLNAHVRSICCFPIGRCRTGTPCSLIIWLATASSSMRVVPYPLHWLQDSPFKGFLKTKASHSNTDYQVVTRMVVSAGQAYTRLPGVVDRASRVERESGAGSERPTVL